MLRLILSLFTVILLLPTSSSGEEFHLALADSTCEVMREAGGIFSKQTNTSPTYSCKSSGLLARGIQAGIIKADFSCPPIIKTT